MQVNNQYFNWKVGLDCTWKEKSVSGSISCLNWGLFGNMSGWRTRAISGYAELQACSQFLCSAKMKNIFHLYDAHWFLRHYKYGVSFNRINVLLWFLQWKNVLLDGKIIVLVVQKNLGSSPSFATDFVFRPGT